MCARFEMMISEHQFFTLFGCYPDGGVSETPEIFPTDQVQVVLREDSARVARLMRWGLVPSWAKDIEIGQRTFNARAETLAQRPSFRDALKYRRCLIPASHFFEWKDKQKLRIGLPGGEPFAFAGLWDRWTAPTGKEVLSCTMITTEPNAFMAEIHTRMPVILKPSEYVDWERGDDSKLMPFEGDLILSRIG